MTNRVTDKRLKFIQRKRVNGMYRVRAGIRPETPFLIAEQTAQKDTMENGEIEYPVFMDYASPLPSIEKRIRHWHYWRNSGLLCSGAGIIMLVAGHFSGSGRTIQIAG